jgi:hypothetical protein
MFIMAARHHERGGGNGEPGARWFPGDVDSGHPVFIFHP